MAESLKGMTKINTNRGNNWNQIHRDSLLKYLNCLDPLFEKAKNVPEFICTLIRVEGIKSAGLGSMGKYRRRF